ncbi:MAG: DNA alkylation repair protein, partial [Actinobacteria bacterium]|nr:DNA alkylation repair protein [Actinomycetota bacterium]
MPDSYVATFTGRLEVLFEERRDPTRAAAMAAYMRDQFPYYGLPAPSQRAAAKEALVGLGQPTEGDLVQLATTCWARPQREWQYAACDL